LPHPLNALCRPQFQAQQIFKSFFFFGYLCWVKTLISFDLLNMRQSFFNRKAQQQQQQQRQLQQQQQEKQVEKKK